MNRDGALRCDCGYDFSSGTMEEPFLADRVKGSTQGSRTRPTWVSAIVLLNVALLVALLLPWSRNWDLALRRAGLDAAVILAFQLWVLGSTLLATVSFVWRRVRETRLRYNGNPMTFDGVFLAAWWTVLVLLSLYALGMGAGG
jgi:hypothetical protein